MADNEDRIPDELFEEPSGPSLPSMPSAPGMPGLPGSPGLPSFPGEEESYPGVSVDDMAALAALNSVSSTIPQENYPAPSSELPTERAAGAQDMGDVIQGAIDNGQRVDLEYLVGNRRSPRYGTIVTYTVIPYIWDAPAGSHGRGYFWGHDITEDCIKSFFISNIQSVTLSAQ